MAKRLLALWLVAALVVILMGSNCTNKNVYEPTGIAVEFNNHAAFIPEQQATMAEFGGFPMLTTGQELWPGMQGDVLVVRTELIKDNPGLVRRLAKVTQRATAWINEHPDDTAKIMAKQLQVAGEKISLATEVELTTNLEVTPEIVFRSMDRIEYTTDINPRVVQDTIDYMVELGYIKEGIKAADILDLTYLRGE